MSQKREITWERMSELKEKSVIYKCDCGCSMLVVEKTVYGYGETNYNISIQDSRYDHKKNYAVE